MNKHSFLFVIFLCSLVIERVFPAKFGPPLILRTVVIDAGHGGKDPGSLGKKTMEKDITLSVALKLGKYIEENIPDMRVVYTRRTDVSVSLKDRPEIANKHKADLFISIHCNSACIDKKVNKKMTKVCHEEVHGAETYVMEIKNESGNIDVAKRENAAILLEDDYLKEYDGFDPNSDEAYIIFSMYQNAYLDQSLNLSAKIQKQYRERAGRADKGVKRASLWVLWRASMPSLLTEIGFITNPEEEKFLNSEKGQDYIASGIFRAFREYKNEVEGKNVKYDDAIEKQPVYQSSNDTIEAAAAPVTAPRIEKDTTSATNEKKIADLYKEKLGKSVKDSIKTTDIPPAKTVYKVQIASGNQKINPKSEKYKGLERLSDYEMNGIYKYTAGEFETEKEAIRLQNELRKKGFPDAFVVAFRDGKRVPLK